MFEYIKGILKEIFPNAVIVETGGIGYKLFLPLSSFPKLPDLEQPVKLYISEVIREDSHLLYGFITKETRNLFDQLGTISGIGPKTALNLIGYFPDISSLFIEIKQNNPTALSKIPGIGKKTAERLIVEMKDKIEEIHEIEWNSSSDALNALLHLGYSNKQASNAIQKALEELKSSSDLSLLIKTALKKISS